MQAIGAHLDGQQQADGFQALLSSVHVIPQEQVVGLRGEPAVLEEAQQVRVLAVHVSYVTHQKQHIQCMLLKQEGDT